ncbi:MAG: hypothetical protein IJU23_14955, partial [Proteobacteria bacterium]|nr:hypothetical protein [Pseudomonadota bacterium]
MSGTDKPKPIQCPQRTLNDEIASQNKRKVGLDNGHYISETCGPHVSYARRIGNADSRAPIRTAQTYGNNIRKVPKCFDTNHDITNNSDTINID